MAQAKAKKMTGRNFALTIVLGVFIAIMVATLFNLVVDYVYEGPKYENYCNDTMGNGPYPVKYGVSNEVCGNCTFSPELQKETEECYSNRGMPIYNYDSKGCTSSIRECDMCSRTFEDAMKAYNRETFFVFALIGFVLIVVGLYVPVLLIQISTLPAGAFLVIEAAVKNFDDKLLVIITFSLLIIAAIMLALKKLK